MARVADELSATMNTIPRHPIRTSASNSPAAAHDSLYAARGLDLDDVAELAREGTATRVLDRHRAIALRSASWKSGMGVAASVGRSPPGEALGLTARMSRTNAVTVFSASPRKR